MTQVIERYEANSFFSIEISWINRITDLSVQTKKTLNVHHMNFKPLTIFSQIPIIYA